jgi:hypothetical protein
VLKGIECSTGEIKSKTNFKKSKSGRKLEEISELPTGLELIVAEDELSRLLTGLLTILKGPVPGCPPINLPLAL